jgi:hypothetical protein
LFTLLVGIAGAFHLLFNSAWRRLDQLCLATGLLYLPAGGFGLFQSRFGALSFGFDEPILFLTAVHFHFAGFASQILTGLAVIQLAPLPSAARSLFRIVAAGIILSPAAIGIGFIFLPTLKFVAISVFALSLALFAGLCFSRRSALPSPPARWLLTLSSASLVIGMSLAALYGVAEYWRLPLIDLDRMTRYHGTLNAFGFTLSGLLAWLLSSPSLSPESDRGDDQ